MGFLQGRSDIKMRILKVNPQNDHKKIEKNFRVALYNVG